MECCGKLLLVVLHGMGRLFNPIETQRHTTCAGKYKRSPERGATENYEHHSTPTTIRNILPYSLLSMPSNIFCTPYLLQCRLWHCVAAAVVTATQCTYVVWQQIRTRNPFIYNNNLFVTATQTKRIFSTTTTTSTTATTRAIIITMATAVSSALRMLMLLLLFLLRRHPTPTARRNILKTHYKK